MRRDDGEIGMSDGAVHKSIEIIIPVRNMADQLSKVLGPLREQCTGDDTVTVVDDASTDDTAEVARALGANVVSLPESRGPYYARQVVAERSTADVLLFVDARCRPLPGLLDAHRNLHRQPDVALSCTDVETLSGDTLAARVAALKDPFSIDGRIGVPGRPDYYPTANLGVARAAFRAVGGFRAMRSGGDADICWRIQRQRLGTMGVDRRVLMAWEPRTTMRDLASQYKRYGNSTAYLQWVYGDFSPAPYGRDEPLRNRIRAELRRRQQMRRASPAEAIARVVIDTAFQIGYVKAMLNRRDFIPPQCYAIDADSIAAPA